MWIYNLGLILYVWAIALASLWHRKAKLWIDGRKGLFDRMKETIDPSARIVWIHAASLGEFEQGRPLIEKIRKEHPEYKILLTFFSPSGYEIRKNYDQADYIFYLPIDTPGKARRFLDIAHPEIAIFVKYEFWLNYLTCLQKSGCRTFIISAIFRRDSVFFKWYGGIFRQALRVFEKLFVQDDNSKELLASIGIDNVIVAGDTRFDRVAEVRKSAIPIPTVAAFAEGHKTLVAGSTWPPDDELLLELAGRHPDTRFVIAPHETNEERIEKLMSLCPENKAVRFTRTANKPIPDNIQIMIIDTIGILSSIYAYADVTYIGGGFGVGIHNTLEAAVYGVPVAFGPNYGKFKEACDLIGTGAATDVSDIGQLDKWLSSLWADPKLLESAGRKAGEYVSSHTGATGTILGNIFLR